ncbi:hypothetical protein [Variovorax sp. HW608]|uniref:hypothetical protein n=1 Tax=Variovorax sp. HW608 TaxID=1034889 RepID=UPI000B5AD6EA|nr:hypothetical protein [Variovorax sp. HW608]
MKKNSSQIVLDAVNEQHAAQKIATRETLEVATGLKRSVLDDRLAVLVDRGEIWRVKAGVFMPAPTFAPPRAVSVTMLPGGATKVEIGDHCLELTPAEARMLAKTIRGHAQEFDRIEAE